ncbi:MAG: DUF2505 domain-containing protein [Acidimicrobiia bacterium]|nr:DUF2505 domain-containing protein [Acidimicrobiia bacterium]
MTFASDRRYDAEPAIAFALFCDPEVVVARYEAMGDRDIEVQRCETDGDGFVIETRRVVEIDLPGFAKKVLSPTNTMVQVDRWNGPDADGARTGTWEVSVDGAPVATRGSMRLTPDGNGSRHHIEGTIEVKVPIVGGRIAKWSEGTAADKLEAELDFHEQRLAR